MGPGCRPPLVKLKIGKYGRQKQVYSYKNFNLCLASIAFNYRLDSVNTEKIVKGASEVLYEMYTRGAPVKPSFGQYQVTLHVLGDRGTLHALMTTLTICITGAINCQLTRLYKTHQIKHCQNFRKIEQILSTTVEDKDHRSWRVF